MTRYWPWTRPSRAISGLDTGARSGGTRRSWTPPESLAWHLLLGDRGEFAAIVWPDCLTATEPGEITGRINLVFGHPQRGTVLDHSDFVRRFKRALRPGGVREVRLPARRHPF